MYQLYYFPRNASWAPHMLLHEMALAHKLVLVDRKSEQQKSEQYLKLNPTGRIPTLVYKDKGVDKVIVESAAIGIHLCERHPEHELIPAVGSDVRPEFFEWLFYLTSSLQSELMLYFYPEKHTSVGEDALKQRQEARGIEMLAHMDAHGVDPEGGEVQLSGMLEFDVQKSEFTGAGSDKANSFLKRKYRAPYVVPEVS